MAEIPLEDLKVGDHVLVNPTKPEGATPYPATVKRISASSVDVIRDGQKLSEYLPIKGRAWKITEDPDFIKGKEASLTEIAEKKQLPEDVEGVIKSYLPKRGGRGRKTRKTRKTRKSRKTRRS
jgi:hypothetical protein